MKFALNGALTIGTLDGANIEIRELVGEDNFFLFGMTADEVQAQQAAGYHPRQHYAASGELGEALDQIASGRFSGGDANLFRPLVDSLLSDDPYMLLADFDSYVEAQDRGRAQPTATLDRWTRMSILNVGAVRLLLVRPLDPRVLRRRSGTSARSRCRPEAERSIDATRRLGQPSDGRESRSAARSFRPEQDALLRDLPLLVGLDLMHATHSGAQGTLIELATAVAAPTATARFLTGARWCTRWSCSEVEMIERSERIVDPVGARATTCARGTAAPASTTTCWTVPRGDGSVSGRGSRARTPLSTLAGCCWWASAWPRPPSSRSPAAPSVRSATPRPPPSGDRRRPARGRLTGLGSGSEFQVSGVDVHSPVAVNASETVTPQLSS